MQGGQGGDDTLVLTSRPLSFGVLVGDSQFMGRSSSGGNDSLRGGDGADELYGDARDYSPAAPGAITGGRDVLTDGNVEVTTTPQ